MGQGHQLSALNRKSEICASFLAQPGRDWSQRANLTQSCALLHPTPWEVETAPCSKDFVGAGGEVQEIFLI